MSVLPFLEAVIYGVREVYNGATLLVRKSQLVFRNGLTAQVIGDQIVVDASGGGGGTVPIASGDASTETALDDFAVTGGRNLVVGSDPTLTNTYKFLTFVATDAIDWAVGGSASTMSCNVDGATINNARYLGFLAVADLATLPTTGQLRFPYNGGAAVPVISVKDSGGTTREWVTFDTDTMTIGCAGLTTSLLGGATTAGSVPVTPITEQGAAYALTTTDRGSVVVITGASVKLPAAPTTGDTYSVVNASGADMTVDRNAGPDIYGEAGDETVYDAESRTYVYDGISLNKWVRT